MIILSDKVITESSIVMIHEADCVYVLSDPNQDTTSLFILTAPALNVYISLSESQLGHEGGRPSLESGWECGC